MDIRDRMELIYLLARELSHSVTVYAAAKDKKNCSDRYGYDLAQSECKSSIERKIIMVREQLNEIRQDL